MGVIASAAAQLLEAGITGGQLVAAIAIIEDMLASLAPRDEARPSRTLTPSAIRMRRHRARRAGVTGASPGVTDSSPVTSHVTLCDGSDASNNVNPDISEAKQGDYSSYLRESEQHSLFDGDGDASHVTPKQKPRQIVAYPARFEEKVWKPYPDDRFGTKANMSKKDGFLSFWRKPEAEKLKIEAAIPLYANHLAQRPDQQAKHLKSWIDEGRYQGLAEKTARAARAQGAAGPRVFVERDTPEWAAWEEWTIRRTGRGPPVNQQNGWYFPSAFPPRDDQKMEASG